VGSRAKAARTRARLLNKGFTAERAERVRMPLGVDVGARSPAEISVAIAAELVSFRSALTGVVRGARSAETNGEAATFAEATGANAEGSG
jgi:xanthine dehydrogenase accessory factor